MSITASQPARPPDLRARLNLLHEIIPQFSTAADIPQVVNTLAQYAARLFEMRGVALVLEGETGWELHVAGSEPDEAMIMMARQATGAVISPDGLRMVVPMPDSGPRGTLVFTRPGNVGYTGDDLLLARLLASAVSAAVAQVERVGRLNERIDTLEVLNQELDAYDYSAAHDLKAPLNIINNYAFLLHDVLEEGDLEAADTYIGEIMLTARAMARLLDQLLLVTRAADEDDIPPTIAPLPVLEQVIGQFQQPLQEADISLEIIGPMPQVRAYPVQLETVFANLIGNAIKYMGRTQQPRIEVTATVRDGMARFEVRDNGIGMSEGEQAKLFRRFSRVGRADTEGTGLGLAIARRTVERLGGALGVISAPQQGSTFWFTLPTGERSGS